MTLRRTRRTSARRQRRRTTTARQRRRRRRRRRKRGRRRRRRTTAAAAATTTATFARAAAAAAARTPSSALLLLLSLLRPSQRVHFPLQRPRSSFSRVSKHLPSFLLPDFHKLLKPLVGVRFPRVVLLLSAFLQQFRLGLSFHVRPLVAGF